MSIQCNLVQWEKAHGYTLDAADRAGYAGITTGHYPYLLNPGG